MKIYGSVCSGIEAASVAWSGPELNWSAAWFAEIDAFPSAVLAHRFPETPNHGDFTAIPANTGPVDVLVGGTPCQSFSVAGLRGGMADERGNLALEFLRLAGRLRPPWVVWENVPGVLSSAGGRDFGSFLGGLAELGYGFAYRILDAQFVRVDGFGRAVPQRRRRVFVVGHLGDWRRAAAVLFDRASVSRNPPPGRKAGSDVAGTLDARTRAGGFPGTDGACSGHIVARPIAPAITGQPYGDHESREGLLVAKCLTGTNRRGDEETENILPVVAPTLFASNGGVSSGYHPVVPAAYRTSPNCGAWETGDRVDDLTTGTDPTSHIIVENSSSFSNTLEQQANTSSERMANNAYAEEVGPGKVLRALRKTVGEEAFEEWGLGVLASLLTPEVLRSLVHGGGFRCPPGQGESFIRHRSSSQSEIGQSRSVLQVWEAGRLRCSSQGWRLDEQLHRELGAYLSLLPLEGTQSDWPLRDMRQASEGLGLLRQALSAIQATWRSAETGESSKEEMPRLRDSRPQPRALRKALHAVQKGDARDLNADDGRKEVRGVSAVRRLTPRLRECERLQGFPDNWSLVPYRGKLAKDGPRYRAIGNSMAVNCMRWIGQRIDMVSEATS